MLLSTKPSLPLSTLAPPAANQRQELIETLHAAGLTITQPCINLFRYLSSLNFPIRVTALSNGSKVPLSTTYRLLQSFQHQGLADFVVDKSSTQRWFRIRAGDSNACSSCGQLYHIGY
jgi:Fe2+ or Zn2+ uptake regulation protein